MPPSSRIPPLLQPYTRLPKDNSILLLTSTLGASANWLIIRFLCEALNSESRNAAGDGTSNGTSEVAVVLVSWMREWEFWKQEARKGGGLDLERLKLQKRFAFVDGLSKLFVAPENEHTTPPTPIPQNTIRGATARAPQTGFPARGPPGRTAAAAPTTTIETASMSARTSASTTGHYTLSSPSLQDLQSTVQAALAHISAPTAAKKKTLLLLDNPDILLSATPTITTPALSSTLLALHTEASHVLVHIQADTALLSLSTPPQPLEIDHHNFLVKTAHMSRRVVSCRVLDTGVARDVSGVLRVTDNGYRRGAEGFELREEGQVEDEEAGNRELLYFVKGDGSVKVFERGAGS